jgi:hypothetical protein
MDLQERHDARIASAALHHLVYLLVQEARAPAETRGQT